MYCICIFAAIKIGKECQVHRPVARQHQFNDNVVCGKNTCHLSWKKVVKSGYSCQTEEGDAGCCNS